MNKITFLISFVLLALVAGGVWGLVSDIRMEKICGQLTFEDGTTKPDCWLEIGKY